MILKILSSNTLPPDLELKLGRKGLKHGLREAKDYITFFGCKKYDENRNICNDFVIPSGDPVKDAANRG